MDLFSYFKQGWEPVWKTSLKKNWFSDQPATNEASLFQPVTNEDSFFSQLQMKPDFKAGHEQNQFVINRLEMKLLSLN